MDSRKNKNAIKIKNNNAINLKSYADHCIDQADVHCEAGSYHLALDSLSMALTLHPNNEKALYQIAKIHFELNNNVEAFFGYIDILDANSAYLDLALHELSLLLLTKKSDVMDDIQEHNTYNIMDLMRKMEDAVFILAELNQNELANICSQYLGELVCLQVLAQTSSEESSLLSHSSQRLVQAPSEEEASSNLSIDQLFQTLQLNPHDKQTLYKIAEYYDEHDQFIEAISFYLDILLQQNLTQFDVDVHKAASASLFSILRDMYENIFAQLDMNLNGNSININKAVELGVKLHYASKCLFNENLELAFYCIDYAVRLLPSLPVYFDRACMYSYVGHHDIAIVDYTQALLLSKEGHEKACMYYSRGMSHLAQHHNGLALNDFESHLEFANAYPHPMAHFKLGKLYGDKKHIHRELINYMLAISIDPLNDEFNNELTYICNSIKHLHVMNEQTTLDMKSAFVQCLDKCRVAYENQGMSKHALLCSHTISSLNTQLERSEGSPRKIESPRKLDSSHKIESPRKLDTSNKSNSNPMIKLSFMERKSSKEKIHAPRRTNSNPITLTLKFFGKSNNQNLSEESEERSEKSKKYRKDKKR